MASPVMTTPPAMVPLGLTRDANHVYGWSDGRTTHYPIPSVTRILSTVDKSGPLMGWAKKVVAQTAVREVETIARMRQVSGDEATVRWLTSLPGYQADTAASLGSRIHWLADQYIRGLEPVITDEERPYLAAYQRWLTDARPRFLASEEMVVNLRFDYAGTFDAIAVIDGETWIIDIKSGAGIYPETSMQLAAYAHAQFIGRTGSAKRFRIPRPTRFGVVHVRPEGARLVGYMETPGAVEECFRAFIHARGLYGWQQGLAKGVIGAEVKNGRSDAHLTLPGQEPRVLPRQSTAAAGTVEGMAGSPS